MVANQPPLDPGPPPPPPPPPSPSKRKASRERSGSPKKKKSRSHPAQVNPQTRESPEFQDNPLIQDNRLIQDTALNLYNLLIQDNPLPQDNPLTQVNHWTQFNHLTPYNRLPQDNHSTQFNPLPQDHLPTHDTTPNQLGRPIIFYFPADNRVNPEEQDWSNGPAYFADSENGCPFPIKTALQIHKENPNTGKRPPRKTTKKNKVEADEDPDTDSDTDAKPKKTTKRFAPRKKPAPRKMAKKPDPELEDSEIDSDPDGHYMRVPNKHPGHPSGESEYKKTSGRKKESRDEPVADAVDDAYLQQRAQEAPDSLIDPQLLNWNNRNPGVDVGVPEQNTEEEEDGNDGTKTSSKDEGDSEDSTESSSESDNAGTNDESGEEFNDSDYENNSDAGFDADVEPEPDQNDEGDDEETDGSDVDHEPPPSPDTARRITGRGIATPSESSDITSPPEPCHDPEPETGSKHGFVMDDHWIYTKGPERPPSRYVENPDYTPWYSRWVMVTDEPTQPMPESVETDYSHIYSMSENESVTVSDKDEDGKPIKVEMIRRVIKHTSPPGPWHTKPHLKPVSKEEALGEAGLAETASNLQPNNDNNNSRRPYGNQRLEAWACEHEEKWDQMSIKERMPPNPEQDPVAGVARLLLDLPAKITRKIMNLVFADDARDKVTVRACNCLDDWYLREQMPRIPRRTKEGIVFGRYDERIPRIMLWRRIEIGVAFFKDLYTGSYVRRSETDCARDDNWSRYPCAKDFFKQGQPEQKKGKSREYPGEALAHPRLWFDFRDIYVWVFCTEQCFAKCLKRLPWYERNMMTHVRIFEKNGDNGLIKGQESFWNRLGDVIVVYDFEDKEILYNGQKVFVKEYTLPGLSKMPTPAIEFEKVEETMELDRSLWTNQGKRVVTHQVLKFPLTKVKDISFKEEKEKRDNPKKIRWKGKKCDEPGVGCRGGETKMIDGKLTELNCEGMPIPPMKLKYPWLSKKKKLPDMPRSEHKPLPAKDEDADSEGEECSDEE